MRSSCPILAIEYGAAPALNEINLEPDEVWSLFREVLENIRLMLSYGRVHADLSAYNILYWQGEITLIDFPQVINSRVSKETHMVGSQVNPDAAFILERDIGRVCEYFTGQGVRCDAPALFSMRCGGGMLRMILNCAWRMLRCGWRRG